MTPQPLFRFAVIADTHVNPTDDQSNSPWEVNRRANARTRRVMARVAAEEPEFVIHLGDMVHPVPGTPTYDDAAQRFFELSADLDVLLHLVPGNHDAGDKPVDWAPANPINDSHLDLYERTFGSSYYAFDHDGHRFIVLNTMLVNSGLAAEATQEAWLEEELGAHAQRRTFVFGHYPLYLRLRDEPECYDNIGEPGRTWLLDLFARHRVEAYFAGHVHNFFYNHHEGTHHYVLPSTSFVRHDYSELARIEPGPQYGRDDVDKLGHMVVEVHEDHHVAHIVRNNEHPTEATPPSPRVAVRHDTAVPVGIDMRQHWAETASLPYNGMLDEFVRRTVRNDYPLMALWELGVQTLRIPLNDLADPELVDRMHALGAVGHRFHVFAYDLPANADRQVLARVADVVSGVEIILPRHAFDDDRAGALHDLRSEVGVPVVISPLITSAHTAHTDGSAARFAHHVGHGFDPHGDVSTLDADGIAFRVPAGRSPWQQIQAASATAAQHGVQAVIQVTLAGEDPAADSSDGVTTMNRVAETLLAAWRFENVLVFLDTLADVDRGYFPRRGLIDRRYNPRRAGTVFRHLHAALARTDGRCRGEDAVVDLPGGSALTAGRVLLVLPTADLSGRDLLDRCAVDRVATVLDLVTGDHQVGGDMGARNFTTPALITLGPGSNQS